MSYLTGDPLQVRIRIAFGASIAANPATWVWTDVTAWWHVPDDVTISWGRSSGAEQPETSTFSATLKNTDGRFTAFDPRSPYWPNVTKWTPIQYDIDLGDGAGWRNRFSGYIRKWPLTWPGASPLMALAKVEAVGVLGRIGRGKPPSRSPLRRTILASGPVAYWPGEDGVAASRAGSAMSGASPLSVAGTVEFTAVADYTIFTGNATRYGTTALANLAAGGSLQAQLPASAVSATAGGAWTVTVAMQVNTLAGLAADVVVLEWTTSGGTYTRWQLKITTTLHTQVVAFTPAGAATILIDDTSASPAFVHHTVSASLSGGTVTVRLYRDSSTPSTTFGGTLGGVTSMAVNPTGATSSSDMPAGHIAVWATGTPPLARTSYIDSYGGVVREARRSWEGEAATDRLTRLAAEDGLTLTMPAVPADAVTRMGWQAPGTPIELYQQCEAADQGLIYEAAFGLGYLPRAARYNAPVTLTIDAAAGQLGMPFEPIDDDQMLRNVWTVERIDGSSAVAADPESIDQQGEIEGSAQLNLATDDLLSDHASWRLRMSMAQEPRYPAVSINLLAHPDLAAAWCACRAGSRVQIANPPDQNVPGTVDQLVVGASETYRGRRGWRATLNVVPASPWGVATVDGTQRVAVAGSTLGADLSASDTSAVIASTVENGLWTQDPADFPLDVRVGGEQVTVSAIEPAAALNANALFEGGTVAPWSSPDATVSVSTAQAHSGSASMLLTPTGAAVMARAESESVPCVPGRVYQNFAWVRCAVARTVDINAVWFTAGGGFISIVSNSVAVPANTWVPLGATFTAPVGAGQARAQFRLNGTPPAGHLTWIDEAFFTTVGHQTVTLSARGVNGVTRSWPAGTGVNVWQPAIAAL